MISSSNLKLIDVAEPKSLKSTIKGITEKVETLDNSTVKIINVASTMTLTEFYTAYGEGHFVINVTNCFDAGIYHFGISLNGASNFDFELENTLGVTRAATGYPASAASGSITFEIILSYNSPYKNKYLTLSDLGVQVVYDSEGYPCWEDED